MWPSTVTPVGTCPGEWGDRGHGACSAHTAHPRRIRLYVDDELQNTGAGSGPSRQQQDRRPLLQLGGSPEPGALSNLTGCIGNVFVKR